MLSASLLICYSLAFISDVTASEDFNDLGKLMLAGFLLAVGVALAFTFVRLRLRDRKTQNASVLSITAVGDDE
jgi:hypothetical protein